MDDIDNNAVISEEIEIKIDMKNYHVEKHKNESDDDDLPELLSVSSKVSLFERICQNHTKNNKMLKTMSCSDLRPSTRQPCSTTRQVSTSSKFSIYKERLTPSSSVGLNSVLSQKHHPLNANTPTYSRLLTNTRQSQAENKSRSENALPLKATIMNKNENFQNQTQTKNKQLAKENRKTETPIPLNNLVDLSNTETVVIERNSDEDLGLELIWDGPGPQGSSVLGGNWIIPSLKPNNSATRDLRIGDHVVAINGRPLTGQGSLEFVQSFLKFPHPKMEIVIRRRQDIFKHSLLRPPTHPKPQKITILNSSCTSNPLPETQYSTKVKDINEADIDCDLSPRSKHENYDSLSPLPTDIYSNDVSEEHYIKLGYAQVCIQMYNLKNKFLGIEVEKGEEEMADLYQITQVYKDGAFSSSNFLQIGDYLYSINGKCLLGLSKTDLYSNLKCSSDKATILLWRKEVSPDWADGFSEEEDTLQTALDMCSEKINEDEDEFITANSATNMKLQNSDVLSQSTVILLPMTSQDQRRSLSTLVAETDDEYNDDTDNETFKSINSKAIKEKSHTSLFSDGSESSYSSDMEYDDNIRNDVLTPTLVNYVASNNVDKIIDESSAIKSENHEKMEVSQRLYQDKENFLSDNDWKTQDNLPTRSNPNDSIFNVQKSSMNEKVAIRTSSIPTVDIDDICIQKSELKHDEELVTQSSTSGAQFTTDIIDTITDEKVPIKLKQSPLQTSDDSDFVKTQKEKHDETAFDTAVNDNLQNSLNEDMPKTSIVEAMRDLAQSLPIITAEMYNGIFGLGIKCRIVDQLPIINEMSSRGCASKCNNIKIGDILVSVNEKVLLGHGQKEIDHILRVLPRDLVTIKVSRPVSKSHHGSKEEHKLFSAQYQPVNQILSSCNGELKNQDNTKIETCVHASLVSNSTASIPTKKTNVGDNEHITGSTIEPLGKLNETTEYFNDNDLLEKSSLNYRGLKGNIITSQGSPKVAVTQFMRHIDKNGVSSNPIEERILEIEIMKKRVTGFFIEGGKYSEEGDLPIRIKRMYQGAAGEQMSYVLRIGDEILSVNDVSFTNKTHHEAFSYLRSLPAGLMRMKIRRQCRSQH